MEYIHELLGYEHLKIIQRDDMFSFSLDSILLAYFVNLKTKDNIIDLGCGNAPIALYLSLRTKSKITGIEIQEDVYNLATRGVEINDLQEQITIHNENIKNIYKKVGANCYTIVTSNPPYFKYTEESNINKNDYLTIARHEVLITLDEIIEESKKLLVDGGSLYMVHRCERISDILFSLQKHNFGLKRLKFVYPKTSSDKALLVLIEAKKNKPANVVVEKSYYVLDDNNNYTEEILEIFNFKKDYFKK